MFNSIPFNSYIYVDCISTILLYAHQDIVSEPYLF